METAWSGRRQLPEAPCRNTRRPSFALGPWHATPRAIPFVLRMPRVVPSRWRIRSRAVGCRRPAARRCWPRSVHRYLANSAHQRERPPIGDSRVSNRPPGCPPRGLDVPPVLPPALGSRDLAGGAPTLARSPQRTTPTPARAPVCKAGTDEITGFLFVFRPGSTDSPDRGTPADRSAPFGRR